MKAKILKILAIIIGVLVVVALLGFFYLYNNGLSGQYANSEAKEGQMKVACIGDSITYGHGISDWEKNNYPAVLQELLGEEYHVMNFGSSGACVNPEGDQPYVDRAVYQESLDYDADIIVFMIGTNDSKPENWTDAEGFMEDYVALLGSYLEGEKMPAVYIGLCAKAYYSEDTALGSGLAEYDIQPEIVDEISEKIEKNVLQSGFAVDIIDIHSLTEAHPEWFEADGIHPNNDGAKAIAEAVADVIERN